MVTYGMWESLVNPSVLDTEERTFKSCHPDVNIEQFEKRSEAGYFYVGQRLWFFGAKYKSTWHNAGLHIPLTEGEVTQISRNGVTYVAYLSPKTGRPLKKYLDRSTNYSVSGHFHRSKEIQIFETEEEAIEAYQVYLPAKRAEIQAIIEEKSAKYLKWLDELEAPLRQQ